MGQELGADDLEKLLVAIEKLAKAANRLEHAKEPAKSYAGMSATISVMCVVVLLLLCIFQNGQVQNMERKYDRMQDHLNAIYMMAPHLKPKEK